MHYGVIGIRKTLSVGINSIIFIMIRDASNLANYWCKFGAKIDWIYASLRISSSIIRGRLGIDKCGFRYYCLNLNNNWQRRDSIICKFIEISTLNCSWISSLGFRKYSRWFFLLQVYFIFLLNFRDLILSAGGLINLT